MNTVDPAAEYGAKEERKREPMLRDDAMVGLCEAGQLYPWQKEARKVRDHYERLIDEGKLRVVEEVEEAALPPLGLMRGCPRCKRKWTAIDLFCPGCGNKIKR